MVRTYKRKTTRQEKPLECTEGVYVIAVLEGQMGSFKATRQFKVPQTTIEQHLAKKRADPRNVIVKKLGPIICVFTPKHDNTRPELLG